MENLTVDRTYGQITGFPTVEATLIPPSFKIYWNQQEPVSADVFCAEVQQMIPSLTGNAA